MFGGQLKSRTISRGESGKSCDQKKTFIIFFHMKCVKVISIFYDHPKKPSNIAAMEIRKSVIRDRSESRERRLRSVERTRTHRGERRVPKLRYRVNREYSKS